MIPPEKQKPLTKKEKELYFCLGRIEQYWIQLTERLTARKIQNKKAEKFFMILGMWEDEVDLKLLKSKYT